MDETTATSTAVGEFLALLAGTPLDGLTDEQLCAQTIEVERLGRLLDAARVSAAAELADRSRYGLGNDSLAFRLGQGKAALLVEALTRVSPREAGRRIRLGSSIRSARALDGTLFPADHAAVAAAVSSGAIGVDAAEIIVRCLDQAAQHAGMSLEAEENRAVAEQALVEMAESATADEVAVQARAWREALDPDGAEPRDEEIYRRRSLVFGRESNGVRTIRGTLLPVDAALLQSAIDEAEKPGNTPRFLAEDDEARGVRTIIDDGEEKTEIVDDRTRDQRRYDVFAGLLNVGIRASGNAKVEVRSTAQVTAVVGLDDLERGTGVGWFDGVDEPVSVQTIEQLVCSNGKSLVVMGEKGEPLYLYRGRRYFTEQQMQALAVRDGGCVWPGCHSPSAWADGHHVREYERDHGPTNIDNGVLLCPHHHRMLHHSDYEMKMVGGRPYLIPPVFIDADRTPILLGRSRIGVNLALGRRLT
ncbi:HNH endonuclease signature motif containing protein [Conyzicola nivalis]|uniref:HNH endonuclease n=1 Tax=Conyzicola nivalis TaxID=1477021 RepID=A0A916SCJ9_9MICO|nr:HNH endonuclease signature motif containing protein [Conyzicola nivalis]GGA91283.1 HNH endonuclease [Conyzicola nivalis]